MVHEFLTTILAPIRLCCACHVRTTTAIAHQQNGTETQHSNFIINFDVSLVSNNSDIPPFGSSFSLSLHQRMNLSTSSRFTASRCWCHQHAQWSKTFSCRNLLFLQVYDMNCILFAAMRNSISCCFLSAPSFIGDWSFPWANHVPTCFSLVPRHSAPGVAEPTSNVSGMSFSFRVIDTRSSVAFLSCLLKHGWAWICSARCCRELVFVS